LECPIVPVIVAIILFAIGLGLILPSAERLVRGVVGTSVGFGVSPFLISVVLIGFDPENLAVGAVGSLEGEAGMALGSIIGSAMVAAALQGRPEISFGNVAGSVLAFFLFNGGIIALVRPLEVDAQTLRFYLPFCFGTVLFVSLLMMTKRVSRWAGGLLVLLYGVFVLKGYVA
jgi:Ca2+/Na+ antiporter